MTHIHSQIFHTRLQSGLYDAVGEQLVKMGKSALAEAEYNQDFHRNIELWSSNYIYRDSTGAEFWTNIVGEICAPAFGTIIAAKGNHYPGRPGSVRLLIVLSYIIYDICISSNP